MSRIKRNQKLLYIWSEFLGMEFGSEEDTMQIMNKEKKGTTEVVDQAIQKNPQDVK